LLEAEDWILRYNRELVPYTRPKLQAITTQDATPRIAVIRAPETISDTQAWLEKYKPKSPAPAVLPIVQNLKRSLDIADSIGADDPKEIVEVAEKLTRR
jgi:hypothetical protein